MMNGKNPCLNCGTQQPCPEDGCIAFKKWKGIPLDPDEQIAEETMEWIKSPDFAQKVREFMNKKNTPPYQDALDLWGVDSQFGMMHEETAELVEQAATLILHVAKFQKALNQFRRGRIDLTELIEELVDTDIMIEEMKVVLQNLQPDQDIQKLCKEMWDKKQEKFLKQVNAEKEKRGL